MPEFNITPAEKEEEFDENEEGEIRLTPEQMAELGVELSYFGEGLRIRINEIEAQLKNMPEGKKAEALCTEAEELQEQYDALRVSVDDIADGTCEEILESDYEGYVA